MKTLITTVALTLLTLCASAQDFTMSVYKVEVYSFNTIDKDWDIYKTSTPDRMTLQKVGSVISISNEAGSMYTIGKPLKSSYEDCLNFMATDEENIDCGVSFCIISQENHLGKMTILYLEQMLIMYYFRPEDIK